jgi:tetratricopeptide (TPR) repeat protein
MSAPSPSIPVRRAYGLATNFLGFAQGVANENEAAVKTLEEARDAYRSIDALKLDDLPAATAYAEASSWQMSALQNLGRFDDLRKVGDDAVKVTRAVLERRPGDMSALRAEGLILETLSGAEWTDLHLRKALDMIRQSARDWESIVRLDPSNQIGWNNLADARLQAGGLLASLGEVGKAREQLRAALGVEKTVKESGMIGNVLSLTAGYLARFDADAGDRPAAAAALVSNQRFVALAIRTVPEGSFGRAFLPEFLGYYGFPTTGLGYGAYALPVADGDWEAVRRIAHASTARLEQIRNATAPQQQSRTAALEVAYRSAADASYRLNDYATADTDIQRALALRKVIPIRTLSDKRDASGQVMLAAMIAAHLGRDAEARRLLEPVLELHRGLYARKDNEDLTQHVEFAQALYASALAGSPQKAAELKQAAALIDELPPTMRELISVRRVRAWIAEARGS